MGFAPTARGLTLVGRLKRLRALGYLGDQEQGLPTYRRSRRAYIVYGPTDRAGR